MPTIDHPGMNHRNELSPVARSPLAQGMADAVRSNLRRMLFHRAERAKTVDTSCPKTRDHRLRRLEAVLFLSREPLTSRKLSQFANLADATEARTLIRRLNELYDAGGRAFRVEKIAGGYQLFSRPQFANWVRRLEHVPSETRLSAPALETLAVIAYRQPVLRADIEAIRGVSCGEILRQLMERDLVRIGGRSEELGRPYLYATTKHFLRTFGVQTLDQLPRVETMRSESEAPESSEVSPVERDAHSAVCESENGDQEKEGIMPVLTREEPQLKQKDEELAESDLLRPVVAGALEDEDDEDDGYDDDDDDNDDADDDDDDDDDYDVYDDEDEDEDLDDDFDDDDDQWEEVDDDEEEDWDDDEEDDWDYDDDDVDDDEDVDDEDEDETW